MTSLRFNDARRCVVDTVRASRVEPPIELAMLTDAAGRVLARDVVADRDYPPVARSVRDGFALRAQDAATGALRVIGEVRAGSQFQGALQAGETVEIMTGAPVPAGADAIVMVEHVQRDGDRMTPLRPVKSGDFINRQGAESRSGDVVLPAGVCLDFAHIGVLATVGCNTVSVFERPTVAILSTGDEIVPIDATPLDYQIRNSNSYTLAAQVQRAGGTPEIIPVARDAYDHTREMVQLGLQADILLLSGGVSAGKYDIVEQVLADLGAEFFFTRVLIQPGQPLVFGTVRGKFFFGLPGNPVSTMVTFEVFARAAIDLIRGSEPRLPVTMATLGAAFRHKPGLTRFLPACLSSETAIVAPVPWQGSSDIVALAKSNAFLIARDDRECWEQGETIEVLPR